MLVLVRAGPSALLRTVCLLSAIFRGLEGELFDIVVLNARIAWVFGDVVCQLNLGRRNRGRA